jgi:HK97 family phage portal protein
MDLFNRKKVAELETKINKLTANKKTYYYGGAGLGCDSIEDFKRWLSDGNFTFTGQLAYDLYDRSAPLSTAVNRIANAVAGLEPQVRNSQGEMVEASKVLDVLKDPGFGQSYHQFILDYALSYLLSGNAYLITDPFKISLRTPKPFYVAIKANNGDGYPECYTVTTVQNGTQQRFNREVKNGEWVFQDNMSQKLTHVKNATTNSNLEGRSLVESILIEISSNINGSRHNLSVLNNGMRPSGMFSTDDELSDEQYGRLKEQLDQEQSGVTNAGNNLIADGGLKFIEMSKSNRDMDFINVMKYSKEAIASKYNVPLPLMSSESMTLSNYMTAVENLYDDAVFPLAELLFNSIGVALDIEEGNVLTFDRDEVPAIRERRIREAANRHAIGVFSDNETRQGLGYESYEGGDTVYKPSTAVPVGDEDGALDQGEIAENDIIEETEEEKQFKLACKEMGLTKEAAHIEWLKVLTYEY